jgi:hypothetical protein
MKRPPIGFDTYASACRSGSARRLAQATEPASKVFSEKGVHGGCRGDGIAHFGAGFRIHGVHRARGSGEPPRGWISFREPAHQQFEFRVVEVE